METEERICKRCKFWLGEYQYEEDEDTGIINNGPAPNCSCPKWVYGTVEEFPLINGVQYWDYEDFKAFFVVGPEFGCIHWKKRTENKNQIK